MISSEIIADSINSYDCRLTTFVLNFPRIVLAEFNTHRVFSRNSASSRAIPFETMLEMVKTNPFIPIKFQKDHKGMQGTEYFEGKEHDICIRNWLEARDAAVNAATDFELPVTKQLRNRLLEPFMWHRVIVTATDYENFFALRNHKDAEIHIAKLAEIMLDEYNKSEPKSLKSGQWHIPFGDKIDDIKLTPIAIKDVEVTKAKSYDKNFTAVDVSKIELKIKIAIARCARVSYFNFEGKDDYEADIKLCDRLFGNTPKHLSPTEHVAESQDNLNFYGNLRGFKPYRKFFKDENLSDSRAIKKYYIKDADAPNYERETAVQV